MLCGMRGILWLIVDAEVHIALLIIKVNTDDEVILVFKLFNHFINQIYN